MRCMGHRNFVFSFFSSLFFRFFSFYLTSCGPVVYGAQEVDCTKPAGYLSWMSSWTQEAVLSRLGWVHPLCLWVSREAALYRGWPSYPVSGAPVEACHLSPGGPGTQCLVMSELDPSCPGDD